jgi:small multidrug resistance family-3 protein
MRRGTMQGALGMLAMLVVAAALEVGGDAAMRRGLVEAAGRWLAVGAGALVAYGLVVNGNRAVEFGRLMGVYIAVFFTVSQVLSVAVFGERPGAGLLVGGGLIVAGGIVIQLMGR